MTRVLAVVIPLVAIAGAPTEGTTAGVDSQSVGCLTAAPFDKLRAPFDKLRAC